MKKNLKWLYILIGVALIGLIIYFVVKDALREEAELTFPDTIIVENVTDKNVDKIIKALVYNVFDYDTMKIMVANIPSHLEGTDEFKLNAFIMKNTFKEKEYYIFLNKNLNESDYKITLSHEMVHLNQFETGELVQVGSGNKTKVLFKGDTLDYNKIPYEKRPHEIEAHKLDNAIYSDLEKVLYK